MSKYYHLNIYKTSFDFTVYFADVMKNFPREYRYTLGEKLLLMLNDIMLLIYKANNAKNSPARLQYLEKLDECLHYVGVSIRICFELRCLAENKYLKCSEYVISLIKQLNGWLNYTNKKCSNIIGDSCDNENEIEGFLELSKIKSIKA